MIETGPELVVDIMQATHENLKRQNQFLIKTVRYYAETDWKHLTLTDRGEKAREAMERCTAGTGEKKRGAEND